MLLPCITRYRTCEWTKIQCDADNRPPPRQFHTLSVFSCSDSLEKRSSSKQQWWKGMWLFGGKGECGPFNDMWFFTFETQSWEQVIPQGENYPSPRYGHTCVSYSGGVDSPSALLIYGGNVYNSFSSNI